MSKITALPQIGTEAFWRLYDNFCNTAHLEDLIIENRSSLILEMCAIAETAHRSRAIHSLCRPEREWEKHNAWFTLRNALIQNDRGDMAIEMRIGDVIVVEWGWDRDVIITHNPISRNIVSGYLLSGKWEPMVGLFLPLFDRHTIIKCIEFRTRKNAKEAMKLAEKEAKDWQWPQI